MSTDTSSDTSSDTHPHTDPHGPGGRVVERHCDVAVVGGSAAGLAAALQLARQRRTVIVVDDGAPRNAPAGHVHGYLGHEGVAPAELLATARGEVRRYGGEVLGGRALSVHANGDDRFRVELTGGHRLLARRVLAATGLVDELPGVEGLAQRWGRDVVACPFCHGFELRDRRVVQIVTHPPALHATPVLRHLTGELTVVLRDDAGVEEADVAALEGSGVPVVRGRARRLTTHADGAVAGVELDGGDTLPAETVVVAPRFRARAEALEPAGIAATPHPWGLGEVIEVDATGRTGVPGIYAAGSLTDPSLQVLPSAAHGSRVGAAIAVDLAEEDLRTGRREPGERADWEHRYAGEDSVWSANPNGTLVRETSDLPVGRALDVGAGEGADALWLAEHGWDVTAADISAHALARVRAEAKRRGLRVRTVCGDANAPDAYPAAAFDLVSLQYGSFLRTPDQRGLRNVLGAVAPGGRLLVVAHDTTPLRDPVDVAAHTVMFDPDAYVGVEEFARAVESAPNWAVEVCQTRDRPPGAASTHHARDVVLRARRQVD